ncbi:MAG: hypothetical protein Q7R45_13020 [Sulfuricaulis sp.]|nr:hypothetical protein [Sulfuricaulis sp.]
MNNSKDLEAELASAKATLDRAWDAHEAAINAPIDAPGYRKRLVAALKVVETAGRVYLAAGRRANAR